MIQLPDGITPEHAWPWLRGTKRILRATVPSALPGTHLISATDFSGTHSQSQFWVCSCLFANADLSPAWPTLRMFVRQKYLNDGRRMAYKALNDKKRQEALPSFLDAADTLSGIICTIAVDKNYMWMATSPTTIKLLTHMGTLVGKWGSPAFETMCRVVLIWSAALGCISTPAQHVTWITDEDDIAANDDRLTDLLNYAGRMSGLFTAGKMGELAVNTTAIDSGDRGFEDFVSIPDLCAGMMADILNNSALQDVESVGQKYLWKNMSGKGGYLCDWYFGPTGSLRRVAILIVKRPNGGMLVQRIQPDDEQSLSDDAPYLSDK
jgi:hypothetical protein